LISNVNVAALGIPGLWLHWRPMLAGLSGAPGIIATALIAGNGVAATFRWPPSAR
jgi:hypothetical protein